MRKIDGFLLAAMGVLLIHKLAYTFVEFFAPVALVNHSHLAAAWSFGSFAMLACLARTIVVSVKRRHHADLNARGLAAAIAAGFAVLEQAERLLAGYEITALFSEPVFWVGLAFAPLVAVVLSHAVRSVTKLAANWAVPGLRTWPSLPVNPLQQLVLVPAHVVYRSATSRRGPPVR